MKQFAYLDAQNFDAAAKAAVAESVHVKGAGTDLVDLLKSYIVEPDAVVNLLPIREKEQEGQISALSTLEDVATDEWVKLEFPALHTAAHEAATPQVRHVGTVGGNLAQNTRCWYYRTPGHECRKKGDEGCAAESPLAQNKYHGIFASGGCAAAHTSNLAPALIALKAQVECVHPDGNRTMDAELLYDGEDLALRPGELIRAVKLAPSPMGRNSVYLEVRERQSFDFAIAAVAAAAHVEGGKVKEIRIVAGGVAPTPYRLRAVENALTGKKLDPDAAEFAAEGAKPLAQNAFKVPILKQLVRRALKELAQ